MFTYAVASDPRVAGYAMVSERFLAVIGAEAGDTGADHLWKAVSGTDATLEAVLSALARRGITTLPDFAVVELTDVATRSVAIAVRGGVTLTLAGNGETRTGAATGTWSESTAHEVTGLTLRVGHSRALGVLPLSRGVVRADLLAWGMPVDHPTPAARTTRAPETTHTGDAPIETLRRDRSRSQTTGAPISEGTELSRRRTRGRPVLRFSADRVLELDRPLVFGRSPRPAAHPGARLVSLPSPHREISTTHLEVHVDGDALVARDLDSTNGTIIREPGGSSMLLRHGSSTRVGIGTSLDLGDGAIAVFEVVDGAG